jgi:hypothetical protein
MAHEDSIKIPFSFEHEFCGFHVIISLFEPFIFIHVFLKIVIGLIAYVLFPLLCHHPPHNRLHQLLAIRLRVQESGFEVIAEGDELMSWSTLAAMWKL